MLLGLALEFVDCFNRKDTPVVMNSFERVVSIESERFVEQLYDEILAQINLKFDFSQREESKINKQLVENFSDLEVVYTNQEMDDYLEVLINKCDIELSKRLKNILSIRNLVDVRNDFEQRISNYFESTIKEQNTI
jgi:hypothetical protein